MSEWGCKCGRAVHDGLNCGVPILRDGYSAHEYVLSALREENERLRAELVGYRLHHCAPPLGNPTREEAMAELTTLREKLAAMEGYVPSAFQRDTERHTGDYAHNCCRHDPRIACCDNHPTAEETR